MSERDKTTIIADVRIHIDEIGANDSSMIGDNDDAEMDNIIAGHVLIACDVVRGLVRADILTSDDVATITTAESMTDNTIVCAVPDNAVRIVSCRNSAWGYNVASMTQEGTSEAMLLLDEYVGASVYHPGAIAGLGKVTLVGRSATAQDRARESVSVTYVGKAAWSDDKIQIGDKIYDAVMLYTAMSVLMTYGDTARTQLAQARYNDIIARYL